MRPLEILTPIVLAIYLLYPLTGRKRTPAVGLLPAFAFVIVATHANVEGMRWQMIPLYAFTIVTLFLSIPAFFRIAQNETSASTTAARHPKPGPACPLDSPAHPSACSSHPRPRRTLPGRHTHLRIDRPVAQGTLLRQRRSASVPGPGLVSVRSGFVKRTRSLDGKCRCVCTRDIRIS